MPRYALKQPNGKYAIYSTVVDHIAAYEMERDEAIEYDVRSEMRHGAYPGGETQLRKDINRMFENLDRDGRSWRWAMNWDEAISMIREVHGENDETLRIILSRIESEASK